MIIITGMDNTGKTTLAHSLTKELGGKLVKSPGPSLSPDEQRRWVGQEISREDEKVRIYERFPIFEELIYGNILRGTSAFEMEDIYFKMLRDKAPLIVYTRPKTLDILNWGDRPQMKGVKEKSLNLLHAYDELMFQLIVKGWKVSIFDYKINNVEQTKLVYELSQTMDKLGRII